MLRSIVVCALWGVCACGDDDAHSPTRSQVDAAVATRADANPRHDGIWTMMGFDARNHYQQTQEHVLGVDNAADLKEQWRVTVAGYPTGSPVVAKGVVYVMSSGATYALDIDTGAQRWRHDDIGGTASPAYVDGFLYLHSGEGDLYKLDASDGSVVWGPVRSFPSMPSCDGTSSPIVAKGKVLVGHSCGVPEIAGGDARDQARGGVEAFDAEDGSHAWTYWTVPESGENGAMVWSTVAVDADSSTVFASTGNNYTMGGEHSDSIHAFDLETGERKWVRQVRKDDVWSAGGPNTTGEDTDFGANPILADVGDKKLVAAGDKGSAFWALDRETGEIVWSYDKLSATHTASTGGVLNNGAFDGERFYVASNEPPGESILHVLDGATGKDVRDPVPLGATVWGALSLANGLLLVPINNELAIFDAQTGDELVRFDTGGTIAAGAPAVVDGKVIVKSGLSYAFATDAMNNNEVICYGL